MVKEEFSKNKDYTNLILSERDPYKKGRLYYFRERGVIEDVKTSKKKMVELSYMAERAASGTDCTVGTILDENPGEAADQCRHGSYDAHEEHLKELKPRSR